MIGVIGDIHGCSHTLTALLESVRAKFGAIDLYCVGDLVDRGINSRLVLDCCINEGIKVALGNHDCMFLYAFKYPNHPYRTAWVLNGNYETLQSYASLQDDFARHVAYLESLPLFYNLSDCFISHAGISVLYDEQLIGCENWDDEKWGNFISLEMERDIGVLWNRSILYNIGKLQVVGHTRQKAITYNKRSDALYVDTAACVGNELSCAIIENGKWIDTVRMQTKPADIYFPTMPE